MNSDKLVATTSYGEDTAVKILEICRKSISANGEELFVLSEYTKHKEIEIIIDTP